MKNNQPARIVSITILVAVLISPGAFWQMPECAAQNRLGPADYDYHSLALASIANSTREASKLPGVPQKVKLSLYAAKVLAPFQRDEAIRLLDVSLVDLKQWVSVGKVSGYQRYLAGELRNDVLGLYASLDSEKATALQKEFKRQRKRRPATPTPHRSRRSIGLPNRTIVERMRTSTRRLLFRCLIVNLVGQ